MKDDDLCISSYSYIFETSLSRYDNQVELNTFIVP